jgi:hypothetical protein
MPSSNTPSDLKTVVVCALDAACLNATDENSNDCLSRSFADIKELPTAFVPRDGDPHGIAGASAVFFIFSI